MSQANLKSASAQVHGIVASFADPGALLHAAEGLYQSGYRKFEVHSPFPIHGMDDAMHEKRSRISYFAAAAALFGGVGLLTLIWWIHTRAYPLVISGKPDFSYQAFFPPIFAICVLSAAFGALLSFMGLMNLKLNHPLFESNLFTRFSDDGFIVTIEAADQKFDGKNTEDLLRSLGADRIELVEVKL